MWEKPTGGLYPPQRLSLAPRGDDLQGWGCGLMISQLGFNWKTMVVQTVGS
jgi:hypothetical protein